MGGSSSKTNIKQKEDIKVFNEDNMKIVSKQLNTFVTETLVKNAQGCSSLQLQDAEINLANCEFGDDATVNLAVTQKAVMELSCISNQEVVQKTQTDLISHIMRMIESNINNATISQMNAKAKTASESGAVRLPWGGADATANTDQERKYEYTSKTNKYIEDVVANSVINRFTSESVQNCISNQIQTAAIRLNRCKFGDRASVNAEIDQATKAVTNCVQKQNYGGTVVQGVLNTLGLKDETERTTVTKTKTGAESEAEAVAKGAIEELGDALGSTLKGLGDAIGGIFGGLFGGPIAGVASICCCLLLIIVGVALYFFMGDDDGPYDATAGEPGEESYDFDDADMPLSNIGDDVFAGGMRKLWRFK